MKYQEIINKINEGEYLSKEEVGCIVNKIKNKKFNDFEFISLLVTLQKRNETKGSSVLENLEFIKAFKKGFDSSLKNLFCNSGTGGDKIKTINISTLASIIIASAGVQVLKNGSMGTTGRMGAKEALECLGIDPLKELDQVIKEVKKVGIGYHDFSKLVPIKARTGTRTIFNLLGPLCNPANLKYKLLGCLNKEEIKIFEYILKETCKNYMITYNTSMDEISLSEPTLIIEKRNGVRKEYLFDPEKEGLKKINYEEIKAKERKKETKQLLLNILKGKSCAATEIVCLNAGAGLYLTSKANSIKEGYALAKKLVLKGDAIRKLNEWKEAQNECSI
ncbi:MAG: anthranilate phosphoribosyltransferase [archaeon]